MPGRVHVRAPEEVGLHVHLLDFQLAGLDLLVDVLVAGIEAARVAAHADDAGFFLHLHQALGIRERVRDGNLDLHVLAGAHALHALLGVHPGGRRQDHGFEAGLLQALAEIAGQVRNLESLRHFFGGRLISAGQGDDFDARNIGAGLPDASRQTRLAPQRRPS